MKVPHNILGRTRPSPAGLDPLRVQVDADAFGAGIARGLSNLAEGFSIMARKQEQRTEKLDRFQSMSNFSDFEIQVNEKLTELKRNADPTGKGFVEQANKMYDLAADEFIAKMVPEDMKMEARYWTSNTRQRIIGDSMNFQYQAGDAYFRQGVDKQYQNSLKALDPKTGGDPAQLPAQKKQLFDTIDATDLPEIEKAEMKRTVAIGLEGVVYKHAFKVQDQIGGGGVKGLIRKEEGFRTTPYWDTNAWRIGYGSDTITRADGTVMRVAPGMTVSKADAERDLDRRINQEFIPRARNQIGARAWGALPGSAQAALASVAYNYGSLPNSVVNAAKTGNLESLAASVANLSANKERRRREADMILSRAETAPEIDIDNNPNFADIPYETRVALQQDARSELAAEQKAADEALKLQINTKINDLMNYLNDGLPGGQEKILKGRQEGWLTDYDDISRAQALWEKKNEENLAAQRALDMMTGKRTADPTSDEDRKSLNAVVGKAGLSALDNMNAQYLTSGIVPMVTQVGDIPTDVVGLLQGMARSNNQQKALFAYDALAMLQDADPRAYQNRVPDDVEADVAIYRARRGSVPADELFKAINGGQTTQERQGRELLYKEAQDILKTKEKGVPTLSTLVEEVAGNFDGWTSSAQQLSVPAFAKQMTFDYETAFTDAYIKSADVEVAKKAASDYVNKVWGVTAAGGVLMKHPPEKAGYPMVMGSYDWIDEQARELLTLPEDWRYELISDAKTESEYNEFKRGGPPPSYQVVVIDNYGSPRLKTFGAEVGGKGNEFFVETNIPARIRFEKSPVMKQAEEHDLDRKILEQKLREVVDEQMQYQGMESEMPPELQQEYDSLQEQLRYHTEERDRLYNPNKGPSFLESLGKDLVTPRGKPIYTGPMQDIVRGLLEKK